ncbi:MAG: hypothetical protein M0C28_01380 [Candidatus Moduliflexus flocculans]|nr:hypothetical protein [Candidatus Moduliflexus flocculans]
MPNGLHNQCQSPRKNAVARILQKTQQVFEDATGGLSRGCKIILTHRDHFLHSWKHVGHSKLITPARLRLVAIAIRRLDFHSGLSFHYQVKMKLKVLVGSGDKIGLLVLPVLAIGLALNILFRRFSGSGVPRRS